MSDPWTKITINQNGSGSPQFFTQMGDSTYFRGLDRLDGEDKWYLWKTDGTQSGTEKILQKDEPQNFTVMDNTLYFTSYDSTNGRELWQSDGTTGGTIPVPGAPHKIGPLTVMEVDSVNYLYFVREDDGNLCELWRTDGTTTENVATINPTGWGHVNSMVVMADTTGDNYLYFSADYQLWKSNGTTIGTGMMSPKINPTGNAFPEGFKVMADTTGDNYLYFTAYDGTNGQQIWKSDGTTTENVIKPRYSKYKSKFYSNGSR